MKLYKLNFLEFIRTKFCVIAYALVNAAMIIYMLYGLIFGGIYNEGVLSSTLQGGLSSPFSSMHNMMKFVPVIFIVMLFISYFYFSRARSNELLESICVTKTGINGFYLNQFLVLFTLAAVTCLISFIFSTVFSFFHPGTDFAYFLYAFKVSVLYFFLTDVVAVLLGFLCSNIKKTAVAYIVLILGAFMFSPLSQYFTGEIYNRSDSAIYPIWRIFQIYPLTNYSLDSSYGAPVNIKPLSIIMFWISLLSLITFACVFIFRTKKIKTAAVLSCLAMLVLFTVGTLIPYAEKPFDYNASGSDVDYYIFSDPEKFVIQKDEAPDFKITSYDMTFDIKNELKGNVTVNVDKPDLSEYKFTLYYGYKLNGITNSNGDKLDYSRDGDYITVYSDSATDSLTFKYKGLSMRYHSNSQGSYLPSGFAYYPINGFHYVYDVSNSEQGRIGTRLETPVPIRVKVNTPKTVFSNLDRIDKNIFEGTSDGLTLISGFYKELEEDGVRVVYPYMDTKDIYDLKRSDSILDEYRAKIKETLEIYPEYKGKTIILIDAPGSGRQDRIFESSDHVLTDSFLDLNHGVPLLEEKAPVKVRLDFFFAYMKYYDKDSELYKLCQQDVDSLPDDSDDLNVILAKKINEYGDETFVQVLNAMENPDARTELDLARSVDAEANYFQHP